MPAKVKISVTVAAELVEEVDGLAGRGGRSAVFEEALESWLRQRRRRSLDRAIEEYYRSLAAEDLDEDRGWAEFGDDSAASW